MKNLKLITLLVAVLTMAAYVKAENYLPAGFFMIGRFVFWVFGVVPAQECIPLIAKVQAWNGFETIGEVCIDVVEYEGTLSTRFQYSVNPGISITRAYSGVHRNCQVKRIFPYQRSERQQGGTTNVTQYVGFDEYDCPAEFPEGCCNRRNCLSPKLKIVSDSRPDLGERSRAFRSDPKIISDSRPDLGEVNAFPADDPSGPWGCRTISGLRRCLTEISCVPQRPVA
ncbi:hypothetical protein NDN08_005933 [Rhodosorus marinus]|uniref:Uncharacterized protein n=1 Tax=Rhodosorus marinus TaxID=101924 RepID=A0AAV8UJ99_9RHOD|nr:hypothetical protein NDN08_005933 [Rhodosorus marinus]